MEADRPLFADAPELRRPKFSDITEFPSTIASCYEGEACGNPARNVDYYYQFKSHGQSYDVYRALMYAQDVILNQIRRDGIQAITPDLILQWLNDLHRELAQTLAERTEDQIQGRETENAFIAGGYAKHFVLRWHATTDIFQDICAMTHELKNLALLKNSNTRNKHASYFSKYYHYPKKTLDDFLIMLAKMVDADTEIPKEILPYINRYHPDTEYTSLEVVLVRMALRYHRNELLPHEKACVDQLAIVGPPPWEIETRMQAFAVELCDHWKIAAVETAAELQTVSKLLAFTFHQIVSIHPYGNGNGRVATVMINIISRSLNYPGFMMREPGQRNEEASSYGKAMAVIDTDVQMLETHIHQQIEKAQQGYIYIDDERVSAAESIMQLLVVLKAYEDKHGYRQACAYFDRLIPGSKIIQAISFYKKQNKFSHDDVLLFALGRVSGVALAGSLSKKSQALSHSPELPRVVLSGKNLTAFHLSLQSLLSNPEKIDKARAKDCCVRYNAFMLVAKAATDTQGEALRRRLEMEILPDLVKIRQHAWPDKSSKTTSASATPASTRPGASTS